jgi:cyclopropane fatty-acyl-phospholipid synthase-like methyltransferase
MTPNNWQRFFDGFAPQYMGECFVTNTVAEVDFVLEETGIAPGSRVLDVGCGTGRHAVELAKRGYRVTGVDISPGMLAEARKTAEEAGVQVELVQSDAAAYRSEPVFDAAICLCEGAFGLLGDADDACDRDLAILQAVRAALKPGAAFVLTTLNGLRMVRAKTPEEVAAGAFDPLTMTSRTAIDWETPEGKRSIELRERGYVPTELRLMARLAGFEVVYLGGGTAGNWGRRPLDLDEMEVMLVARKR